jgi:hypothetical protein
MKLSVILKMTYLMKYLSSFRVIGVFVRMALESLFPVGFANSCLIGVKSDFDEFVQIKIFDFIHFDENFFKEKDNF